MKRIFLVCLVLWQCFFHSKAQCSNWTTYDDLARYCITGSQACYLGGDGLWYQDGQGLDPASTALGVVGFVASVVGICAPCALSGLDWWYVGGEGDQGTACCKSCWVLYHRSSWT